MLLFLKNVFFTILVPGTVAVYIPLWIAPADSHLFTSGFDLRDLIAILLLCSGITIYLWCVFDFAVHGRGTPAPIDAPKRLVVRGLYRYVRSPMYVGVLATILSWALFFSSFWIFIYGIGVGLLFHVFVVLIEEPSLNGFQSLRSGFWHRHQRALPSPLHKQSQGSSSAQFGRCRTKAISPACQCSSPLCGR